MLRVIAGVLILCAGVAAQAQSAASGGAQAGGKAGAAGLRDNAQIDPHSKSVVPGTSFVMPKPIYPVSAREEAAYTVEYVFNFARYNYTPAVAIKAASRAQASYATPEDAFASFYSAILSGDYEWMLNSWDDASQKYIAATNERKKLDQAYWVNLWKERYAGKRIEMVQRIESGLYVLILYRITEPDTGKLIEQDTLPLTRSGKSWLATQALAADPFTVTYPDLKPQKDEAVLMHSERKPADPRLPPGALHLTRDMAQEEFFKDYPRSGKDSVQIVER